MKDRSRNRAVVRFVLLPLMFLTVALLGGLRISAEDRTFVFIAPPLITLLLSVLLMLLFVRARLLDIRSWVSSDHPLLVNLSHAITLVALFFASAQAFNSVLPERGLLFWLFSFFFLWTLWNNQFSDFDPRRLLRSLTVLFAAAFVLKHMLFASLYAPEGGWLKRLAGIVLEGVSLGTLDAQAFAPATGYISFFTLALYVTGLVLLEPAPERGADQRDARFILHAYEKLTPRERLQVREAIERESLSEGMKESLPALKEPDELTERDSEETLVTRRSEKRG